MTTPEQLALLLSHEHSARFFGGLRRIVLDELHALVTNKRGELLSLAIARIASYAPEPPHHRAVGHGRAPRPPARLDRRAAPRCRGPIC